MKSGNGYVLTAAHCCATYVPTVVVISDDYAVGEPYLSGATPVPPAYAVVGGSVYYDAQYSGVDHDFCMLKFSRAPGATATLALPSSAADGLQIGSPIEHVGFGITETSTTNSQRRTGTDTVDVLLTPLVVEFSQGGPGRIPGTCEGDSGGPSLLPAGAPQAQQVVVAVQSFGNNAACTQETLGGASRVSSEIGQGKFITSYLADMPTGTQAGGTPVPAGSAGAGAALAGALLATGMRKRRYVPRGPPGNARPAPPRRGARRGGFGVRSPGGSRP